MSAGLAAVVGLLAGASPASAAPCVGTQGTLVVCVEPTGYVLHEDCVYLGGDTCTPVTVPGPKIWCEGAMAANCDPGH